VQKKSRRFLASAWRGPTAATRQADRPGRGVGPADRTAGRLSGPGSAASHSLPATADPCRSLFSQPTASAGSKAGAQRPGATAGSGSAP
jgi:hypothetical protein